MFIEDLLAEDDWDGFVQAHQKLKGVKLIGDDFIVTNRRRLQKAYERHALDGFILKPNQVGTITEALDTHAYAQSNGLLYHPLRPFRRGCGRYCGRLGAGSGGAHFQKMGHPSPESGWTKSTPCSAPVATTLPAICGI